MFVAVGDPVARRNSAITSRPEIFDVPLHGARTLSAPSHTRLDSTSMQARSASPRRPPVATALRSHFRWPNSGLGMSMVLLSALHQHAAAGVERTKAPGSGGRVGKATCPNLVAGGSLGALYVVTTWYAHKALVR